MTLLPLAEAQVRLLATLAPLPVEDAPLAAAAGRFAAAPVAARRTQPAADLSSMDGYAIRFADLPGPWRVTGEAAAGRTPAPAIAAGEAARIFTGAPLPAGADTVLIQEDTARDGDRLTLTDTPPARRGSFVRYRGAEFVTGAPLIPAGARLTPARLALAATAGHATVAVHRRPRVALLATGDELVPPGEEGGLPASNGAMLAAMLDGLAIVSDHGIVRDDRAAIAAALAAGARDADILVTTGGASVGDHDLVRPALADAGATIDFWRVAMKPGKPLMAGRLGDTLVLGLPGNPVSAFVTAFLFLLPAARALAGAADPLPVTQRLPLAAAIPANRARADHLRARLDPEGLRIISPQDSAALVALAAATHLIVRAPHAAPLATGAMVDAYAIA
jgi:molybdopterin molybdotransferase